jgi:hypothetical protein
MEIQLENFSLVIKYFKKLIKINSFILFIPYSQIQIIGLLIRFEEQQLNY